MRRPGDLGTAAAAAVGAWMAWRIVGPELPRRYPTPQVRPLRLTGRTVLVGEREMFIREIGPADAPPLVLIHGWSLDGELTYHRLIPLLADRYRVVVPDLRNHGRSDWIRGRYEVVDLADEVAGILYAAQVGGATVVGYSLGGMVAQELAARHPELVAALVLGATAARPVPIRRLLVRGAFFAGRAVARVSTIEAARVTSLILRRSGAVAPQHERWAYESLLRRDASLFYEAGAAAVRFDSRAWVGRLPQPIAVVIPSADLLVAPGAQRELAAAVPDAEVVELEGCGHESILTRPADYARVIDRITAARRRG